MVRLSGLPSLPALRKKLRNEALLCYAIDSTACDKVYFPEFTALLSIAKPGNLKTDEATME